MTESIKPLPQSIFICEKRGHAPAEPDDAPRTLEDLGREGYEIHGREHGKALDRAWNRGFWIGVLSFVGVDLLRQLVFNLLD